MFKSRAPLPLLACLLACSSTPPTPAPLKTLDSECAVNEECGQMTCLHAKCTEPCTAQGDCPVGFDCVLQAAADAVTIGATCVKAAYTDPPMGGFGTDCAIVAPDPKTGAACDGTAATPCAGGYSCNALQHCDPEAYCTKGCMTDRDCPPTMFCGNASTMAICMVDSDCTLMGQTCMTVPGGTAKVCQGPSICMKRQACSPCGVDDQCPTGSICATDVNGEKFCGQLCALAENCPQPTNDQSDQPTTNPFQECVPALAGSPNMVCRPVAGTCHGKSAIATITDMNAVCSWCRDGVPGDCANGFCYADSFSKEHFCTQPCTAHVVSMVDGYATTNDTCPAGSHCFGGTKACTGCDITGNCAADDTAGSRTAGASFTAFTCYPLTM